MKRIGFAALALLMGCFGSAVNAETPRSTVSEANLRDVKVTPLKLYLSTQDAYDFLNRNPDTLFIDVRDPVEISINGHPKGIDAIVPARVHSNEYDHDIGEYVLKDNPYFLKQMRETVASFGKNKDDLIIVTCGSGWRSAVAVRRLAEAGYTNVWHIVDGYQGETKVGRNSKNAWQLAGLPWITNVTVPGSAWVMLLD